MKNTPRPAIDPKLVKELIDTANDATDAMCESINLDLAVGNDEFDDVNRNTTFFVAPLRGSLIGISCDHLLADQPLDTRRVKANGIIWSGRNRVRIDRLK